MNETETTIEKPKVKLRHLVVAAIKPPRVLPHQRIDSKDPKDIKFTLTCVTLEGQQLDFECQRHVWEWADKEMPWNECHSEWVLNLDDNKLVHGVVRKPNIRAGFDTRLDTDARFLILQKAGNTYEPVQLPPQFGPELLDQAIAATAKAGSLRAGNTLDEKFVVRKYIEDEQNTFVILDLKAQSGY